MSIVEKGLNPRWDYAAYAAIIGGEHFVNP
jgi:hypothetical protein